MRYCRVHKHSITLTLCQVLAVGATRELLVLDADERWACMIWAVDGIPSRSAFRDACSRQYTRNLICRSVSLVFWHLQRLIPLTAWSKPSSVNPLTVDFSLRLSSPTKRMPEEVNYGKGAIQQFLNINKCIAAWQLDALDPLPSDGRKFKGMSTFIAISVKLWPEFPKNQLSHNLITEFYMINIAKWKAS